MSLVTQQLEYIFGNTDAFVCKHFVVGLHIMSANRERYSLTIVDNRGTIDHHVTEMRKNDIVEVLMVIGYIQQCYSLLFKMALVFCDEAALAE